MKWLRNLFRSRKSKSILAGAVIVIGGGSGFNVIHGGGGGGGGFTPTFFIAQTAQGTGSGNSCANAKAASAFNTAGNWGAGNPIAPGGGVGLCSNGGNITTPLTAQGSGTSGNPITIQFQTGAKLSEPVCDPCLNISSKSYIVVDGGSNGILESNANGTSLANHAPSTGISASSCDNCEVKNLTIQNIYVITSGDTFICASSCAVDNAGARCMTFSGANWLIHDNTMHDASWCLVEAASGSDSNNKIYNNNIYNFDHGWAITGSGPYGKLYFYNNHIHDMGLWDFCNFDGNGDGTPDNCHHDGIHCYFGSTAYAFSGTYIYNNLWDGTVGNSPTAYVYIEVNPTSICSTSGSNWYFFNNKIAPSDRNTTNALIAINTGVGTFYNNTYAGTDYADNDRPICADWTSGSIFKNNVVGGCNHLIDGSGTATVDFNAYANCQSGNCFNVGGTLFTGSFTTYRTAFPALDSHSVFSASGATGSNATGVGTNLTSLCTGDMTPLCTTRTGTARPTTGAWNAGSDN